MTGKKISVIIPAYNVEKYIRRCLDSLVNQTYDNIEIIVVNDGSTDRTHEIIHEYAQRFPQKVYLYDRENGGQAEARNFGLEKATGDYIGFVDSDDFVSTKMYELLYEEAEQTGCDLVSCGYYGCEEESGEITVYQTGYRGEFNQSIYENPHILRINSPYPWNKLYTRELLERAHFRFKKGMIFEDLCAVFPLFLDAEKVGRVHEKLYYYNKGRKGGTISTFNEKHGQIIDALQIMNDAYKARGMFDTFYDTLLFFNIRHIYARFEEMEQYDNEAFKKEFTERANTLLDSYFPGWKESEEFAAYQNGAQEDTEQTDETEDVSEVQDDKSEVPDDKSAVQAAKGKKRSEIFEELVAEKALEENTVLIECYHGNDIRGAGAFIGSMLLDKGGYTVYMAAADAGKIQKFRELYGEKWQYLDMTSGQYLEVLSSAGTVITNRAFPGFYRKRKGQKFVFTDFMPSLWAQGTDVTYGTKNMQGIQFSLAQADWIPFPAELGDEFVPLLKTYHMDEICQDKGVFVPVAQYLAEEQTKQPVRLPGDGKECVIAYVPSVKEFPGLKDSKNYLFLSDLKKKLTELDGLLTDGQKILVCFPRVMRRRFKENVWKHIEFMPDETEPARLLFQCQGMIGEYGEELYWMRAIGKPVCRFVTNEADVAWSQGRTEVTDNDFLTFHSACDVAKWAGERNAGDEVCEGHPVIQWQKVFGKEKKNRKTKRNVVYLPKCKNKEELNDFVGGHVLAHTLFFVEKQNLNDDMAAWLKEWGEQLKFVVIIRSIVVSKKESRLIKYKLTTKEKLKEKRDRERYL